MEQISSFLLSIILSSIVSLWFSIIIRAICMFIVIFIYLFGFYAAFNNSSVISRRQFTYSWSLGKLTSTRLGNVPCPRALHHVYCKIELLLHCTYISGIVNVRKYMNTNECVEKHKIDNTFIHRDNPNEPSHEKTNIKDSV